MAFKNKADATAYQNKFIAKAYDRINLTVPKGKKEIIQAHAEFRKESVNGFINRAIAETMERDKAAQDPPEGPEHAGEKSPAVFHFFAALRTITAA